MSAVVEYCPFISVNITRIGSIGQLHLEKSLNELRYLASKTIFDDSPLAKMITGFMNVLPFGWSFLIIGEIISYCSRLSCNLFNLSCK